MSLMSSTLQRIQIVDEAIFGRICSAILMLEGYEVGVATIYDGAADHEDEHHGSLFVTSYPYCRHALKTFETIKSPVIILTDQIDSHLMNLLQISENVTCMIKPIDYERFKSLVRDVMNGLARAPGGFNVM